MRVRKREWAEEIDFYAEKWFLYYLNTCSVSIS